MTRSKPNKPPMFSLTHWALRNSMLVLSFALIICLAGPSSFLTHPSREDPEITIRTAQVNASLQGLAPSRVEDLITRKLEEKIREMPEVEDIRSVSRSGQATVSVELYDSYYDLEPIWQDLRNKMEDVKSELPSNTQGPFVNDTYGDVAMATVALTSDGFSPAEMRATARELRNKLYSVPGVSKIELFGVEPERIFVEVNNARLSQLGISGTSLVNAIQQTNIISPGGQIEAGFNTFSVEPSGNFESVDDLGQVTIDVPDQPGQVVYLRDLATITRAYVEPPQKPAYFNGQRAIVLSIQMTDRYDSHQFGEDLSSALDRLQSEIPLGYVLEYITFQPAEIATAVQSVMSNLYQTIVIVLLVVILFLGWRTGLIVGSMVPLTMLMTLLVMRYVGIELERMSLATLIISLGLLVDNGIVISEEIGRRFSLGQQRREAVIKTGQTLAMPLLASSLTTIFAFMPLMLAANEAGEYTRSLSLVIAIALLCSWLLAMTITPLLCFWGLGKSEPVDEDTAYSTRFYQAYRNLLTRILNFRWAFIAIIVAALWVALWALQFVPNTFFPNSERTQLQVYVDLPIGTNTYGVIDSVEQLNNWLNDRDTNPEVTSSVAYIAHGGPRFYLGLNPIDPDSHRAFLIVNTHTPDQIEPMLQRVRQFAAANMPDARVSVKPMSMGASEAGLVEYRIYGDDANVIYHAAERVKAAMRDIQGTLNIKDDWENRLVKIVVDVDQARAQRVGITSESIASTLNSTLSGVAVTDYREGDTIIPVYFRAEGDERTNIDRFRTLNVGRVNGTPIPLIQVANLDGEAEFSMIHRHNLERVITVSGKHQSASASALHEMLLPALDQLDLPPGYHLEVGGEIEASAEAQGSLFANMPLAFALIVLVLIGQFNSFKKPLVILGVIPLTLIGVTLGLLIMPGTNLSFMAILGLLSLAGIIINNAIVLIDRIDTERSQGLKVRDAILSASVKRLRPILMTTVTTILGLLPIIISKDVLFYDLAVVLSGGLLIGTVLTLGVVPVLYSFFRDNKTSQPSEG